MRLYLIRHAQSANNALADLRDRVHDPELTDLGLEQAEHVARYLASAIDFPEERFIFDELYTSAMTRTLQTAQPIARELGLQPRIWVDVHEHGGIFLENGDGTCHGFPGLTRMEIAHRFPSYSIPNEVTEAGWWDIERGKETTADFLGRAVRVAQTLRERADEKTNIAIVTHGAFMDALLKALFNQAPLHPDQLFYLHNNTGITRIDFSTGYGQMRLNYLNHLAHLPVGLHSW